MWSHSFLVACLAAASLASPLERINAALVRRDNATSSSAGPIVDLGDGGRYLGKLQNDGKVKRSAPSTLRGTDQTQLEGHSVRCASDRLASLQAAQIARQAELDRSGRLGRCAALRPVHQCVRSALPRLNCPAPPYTGVKAGPGQEDCLKVWVWAPVSAKKGSKLPIMICASACSQQN